LSQVRSTHVFHDQKVNAIDDPKVIHRHHVRMVQFRERSRFTLEPVREIWLVDGTGYDDFESNEPI